MDLAKLIVTLAVRVHDGKSEATSARQNLRACLEQADSVETNGVRRRVEEICPEHSLFIAREFCDELHRDQTGAFLFLVNNRREMVNSTGVGFPLR